jgi:hypothetical protein
MSRRKEDVMPEPKSRDPGPAETQLSKKPPGIDHQRLIALFLLGSALFNFPLLSIFNRAATLFGIPILYVYVFVSWALIIALVAWIIERRS